MKDIFIQSIKVNKARNLIDFDIPLSEDTKKHLIITGKNGSGKTSLLNELKLYLNLIMEKRLLLDYEVVLKHLEDFQQLLSASVKNLYQNQDKIVQTNTDIKKAKKWINKFGGTMVKFNQPLLASDYFRDGNFIIAFFEAKRDTTFTIPTGVNSVKIKPAYNISEFAGKDFIQYIVNLKADRSFARDDNDQQTAEKIDEWFKDFENSLFTLFDSENIQLQFDRKSYNFNIIEDGKEPYNFNQLSGGYSSILSIVTELIIRMEEHRSKSYDVQGVVLIDEIETHLHIDLQKKILPFLTSFFPKIQFIVTTHSPFVLSSIKNAVICDLEKRIVTTDLSGYSYDTLIESYFDSDKYSYFLKRRIERYEELTEKEDLDEEEKDELFEIKKYLKEIPKFISDELAVKLQQIKLKELNKRITA